MGDEHYNGCSHQRGSMKVNSTRATVHHKALQ